ncbi:MAG: shikimate kinase [Firmicutes bacterium]|nr:shikimate kinase [Bacillota bacterium]MCM1400566.1 shikimate kinase [Bacteroides sp.]MCM1476470.1 shikimate kinase [Bacteroides sp.]
MQPIFIIGFMGSGKSTFGRALARELKRDFIDLDNYIEKRFHANIRDIFATRGEDGFRDLERRMLNEVSEFEDVVVACGGGTPCFFNNVDLMNRRGFTVLLTATHATLLSRLKIGRKRRPLIVSMSDDELAAYITEALEKRMPFYAKAAHTFSGDRLDSAEQIAETVSQFITTHNLTPSQA